MALTIDVTNTKGDKTESLPLSEEIFGVKPYSRLVHEVVNAYLANTRHGTHSTKTRGEVSGGGKKPWKQKHTGNARSGSNRSPLWRHGGIIFGPKPHHGYFQPISSDKRRLALKASLSDYLKQGRIRVLDAFTVSEPKTKKVAEIVKKLSLPAKTMLVVDVVGDVLARASRNMAGLKVVRAKDVNAYDVLWADHIAFTKAGLAEIIQRLEGASSGSPAAN